MSESQSPEQQLQSILKNIFVGGNLTTGDISQILNLFVIVQQSNTFIPKSIPYNIPSSNTIKFVGRADAQKLGCLLSLFALAPIPWSLLETAVSDKHTESLEDERTKLEDLYLLESQKNNYYQLHQLIKEFFRNKQNNLATADEQKRSFYRAMVKISRTMAFSAMCESGD